MIFASKREKVGLKILSRKCYPTFVSSTKPTMKNIFYNHDRRYSPRMVAGDKRVFPSLMIGEVERVKPFCDSRYVALITNNWILNNSRWSSDTNGSRFLYLFKWTAKSFVLQTNLIYVMTKRHLHVCWRRKFNLISPGTPRRHVKFISD